jgi:hypothetical protein
VPVSTDFFGLYFAALLTYRACAADSDTLELQQPDIDLLAELN